MHIIEKTNEKIHQIKKCVGKNKQAKAFSIFEEIVSFFENNKNKKKTSKILNKVSILKSELDFLESNLDIKVSKKLQGISKINHKILLLLDIIEELKEEHKEQVRTELINADIGRERVKTVLKIKIGLRYKNWKEPFKSRFLIDLSNYLKIEKEQIEIVDSYPGSIVIILKMPRKSAIKLIRDYSTKNKVLLSVLKLYEVESILESFDSMSKEDFINKLKSANIVNSIKILKSVLDDNDEQINDLNNLIYCWFDMEKLNRENLLEDIQFQKDSLLIRNEILELAKKILSKYDVPKIDESKIIQRKKALSIYDLKDILKKRIINDDLKGAIRIIDSVNIYNNDDIITFSSKLTLIEEHFDSKLINKDEYEILLENIKRELSSLLNKESYLNKNKKESSFGSFIEGTWKLEMLEKQDFFILDFLNNNTIIGWKTIDLNTRLKWNTNLEWLKEIDIKIPEFSVSISGEWENIDNALKLKLVFSIKKIIGAKGQKIIEDTIGKLIKRHFEFDLNEFQENSKLLGNEFGSINDSKVILEFIG